MPTLRWLPEALGDLERLFAFLREHNPQAAARAAAVIRQAANLLLTSPRLGRPLADGSGRRELVIPFAAGGYVLRHRLEADDTVVIMRVWHSREQRE